MNVMPISPTITGKFLNENPLWNYPIWVVETGFDDTFNEVIMDELYSVAQEISRSAHPHHSLWDYPRPNLTILRDLFDATVTACAYSIPELKDLKLTFKSHMGWPNVRSPGLNIDNHAHPDTSFAITYYVKTPKDGGALLCYMQDGSIEKVVPKPGQMIILPFYMLHEVEPNISDDLRISISADYFQIVDEHADNALVLKSWCDDMMKIKGHYVR